MYRVALERGAIRDLGRLPRAVQDRILLKIHKLEEDPRPPGCVKLAGFDHAWRIRVGDYRVIYEIEDEELLVLVIRVRHRREVYR